VDPLDPWKRVFIDEDFFLEDRHGNIECIWCHEGNEHATTKALAHEGLVAFPSKMPEYTCGGCHEEEHLANKTSLHTTQAGYFERFELRAGFDLREDEHLLHEFNDECGVCHTSCGQCHVSRPITVGSGLNWAHEFTRTPNVNTNCTACHGSRIGEEFSGAHSGLNADVHFLKRCEFCHKSSEIHGNPDDVRTYRYDENKTTGFTCEQCHYKDQETGTQIVEEMNNYHRQHWRGDSGVTLTCQVCHSQSYKNCNGCHVAGGGITGSSYLSFEIGRNYLKETNDRYKDYDYITVRHIPIIPDTYAPWGVADLPNFENSEPTWKLTTPHNIRTWTPQTTVAEGQSCGINCHDTDYYLTADDIDYYENANLNEDTGESGYGFTDISREREANKNVIIR